MSFMNVTLRQVRVFAAVATAGSFTLAAEQLCLTQSTLTKSVQELEAFIGLRLFERTTRRLRLTGPGKAFLPVALRLLNDLDTSIAELRHQAKGLRGPVRICCGTSPATTFMPAVIKELQQQYPDMQVRLIDDGNDNIARRIADGGADLGFCTLTAGASALVDSRRILSARMGLLFPRQYQPLPQRITPAMLNKLRLIRGSDDADIMAALNLGHDIATDSHITASNLATQFSLVEADVGPCIVSALAASHPSATGMPYLLLEEPAISRELHLVMRKSERISPAAQIFIEVLFATLPRTRFRHGVTLDPRYPLD
jgi:DNA-binding transcriptional LysR family regulator